MDLVYISVASLGIALIVTYFVKKNWPKESVVGPIRTFSEQRLIVIENLKDKSVLDFLERAGTVYYKQETGSYYLVVHNKYNFRQVVNSVMAYRKYGDVERYK